MRTLLIAFALSSPLVACVDADTDVGDPVPEEGSVTETLGESAAHGRDVWFNNTYGGHKFFYFLKYHPDPQRRINIGFQAVVDTPRAQRFDVWGVINDPDCVANPNGGRDICEDPESSGVVGIRVAGPAPDGSTMYGTTCASCHAGFDPLNPPDDPNEPEWENIHATIGNSWIDFGKIFSANLAPTDPRRLLFAAWPKGSVDTTLLFDDGIFNPGVVTHFWAHKHRPTFDVGMDEEKLRNGQGGEDDVGGDLAALRVYSNIGVCFFECTLPAIQAGQPIDVEGCYEACPDWPPQSDLDDMGEFLRGHEAPQYPGWQSPLLSLYGRHVYDQSCRDCHERGGDLRWALTNDEMNPIAADVDNATNNCRALTTNWETGKLWAEFSSQVYKDRAAAGQKGYRTMPLAGIWATSPFLHNQSIGATPPADALPDERAEYYWDAMWELLSPSRVPFVYRIPVAMGPFPAGTPTRIVFSMNPQTGQPRCADVVENKGHYYGADLSNWDKVALIYWLQYQ